MKINLLIALAAFIPTVLLAQPVMPAPGVPSRAESQGASSYSYSSTESSDKKTLDGYEKKCDSNGYCTYVIDKATVFGQNTACQVDSKCKGVE